MSGPRAGGIKPSTVRAGLTAHRDHNAAVIFSGVCRGISNQGAMVMIQYAVESVKLGYDNPRAIAYETGGPSTFRR